MEAARSVNHRGLPGGGGLWVCILGCVIRQVRVDYDRNYDNYDRCELRRRNYDAPVMTPAALSWVIRWVNEAVLPCFAAGQVRRAGA
jgi:hypothetical protein